MASPVHLTIELDLTIGPTVARLLHVRELLAEVKEDCPWREDVTEAHAIVCDLLSMAKGE